MLAFYGILIIGLVLFAIMSKKLSAIVAMISIPLIIGLIAGIGSQLPEYITSGILGIAPIGVMFIFAILFFGILRDAGTFEPFIKMALQFAKNDPARVAVSAALIAMLVHLDGSGASTFLITIPAFIPIFDKLQMKRSTLACIVALSAGTMNILPWGGPTIRAASSLDLSLSDLFTPLLIPVLIGLISVLIISYYMGKKEGQENKEEVSISKQSENVSTQDISLLKLTLNILTIISAIVALVGGYWPPYLIFMVGFVIALISNFKSIKEQEEQINAHAKEVVLMVGILFAAGCMIGVLKHSGMIEAMGVSATSIIPGFIGKHLPVIIGTLAMPLSLLFDPDSFYFGILPVLAQTTEQFGNPAIEVARAAIIGQMTTGFAVSPLTGSTFLLIGLTGIDLGSHQRKTIPYALLVSIVILITSLIVGAIHL